MVKAWEIPVKQVASFRRFPKSNSFTSWLKKAIRSIEDVDISYSRDLSLHDRRARLLGHSSAAAVEGLLPLATLNNEVVTNSRGIQAVPIAEQVMAGLLARRLNLTLGTTRSAGYKPISATPNGHGCRAGTWRSWVWARLGQKIARRARVRRPRNGSDARRI